MRSPYSTVDASTVDASTRHTSDDADAECSPISARS
jgi:hypothetical protein